MIKKICKEHQVLNPKTNRCVKRDGTIGKQLINATQCEQINLKWNKNSCYIDSLIVGLFYGNDNNYILNAPIRDYGDDKLMSIGKQIRETLGILNSVINNKTNIDGRKVMNILRTYMNSYYKHYNKTKGNIYIIGQHDNWINSQIDVFELFELLQVIFKIRPTLYMKEGTSNILTTFDYMIPNDLLLDKKEVKISDIIPVHTITYHLDEDNALINKHGHKQYVYKKRTKLLKGDKLFIKIYRNTGIDKLNTQIKVARYLKLHANITKLQIRSIIIHYGTKDGGHYICLIRCRDKWYEFDDMQDNLIYIGTLNDINKNKRYKENIVGLLYV